LNGKVTFYDHKKVAMKEHGNKSGEESKSLKDKCEY
jgi:hypothetical protein